MVLVAAPPHAFRTGVAAALCALLIAAPSARAAGLDDAAALLKAGQHEQALLQVNKLISSDPKDAKARFLKGVILTEQGDAQGAADVFQRLTQDYPGLPEPYNNLAVIYAEQGRYDQARVALEKSIRTHPSYATAYENLGDVYSKLASEAYDRALRLDASDASERKKLALVRELAAPDQAAPVRVASRPTTPAAAAPVKSPAPTVDQATAPVTAAAAPAKPLPPAAQSQPPAVVASAKTLPAAPSAAESVDAAVLRTVKAWAQAWSAKDADAYLAFYAPQFKTPDGMPRAQWEAERRARVVGPLSIKVAIRDVKIVRHDDARFAVNFHQAYRSDRFQGHTRKTLELLRVGDDWRIVEEMVAK